MKKIILAAALVAVCVTGFAACGGSGDQTKTAASCLRNALANNALHGGNNCADDTAYKVDASGGGTKFDASCTHQDANQYICQVTGPGTDGTDGQGIKAGFYNVTFDGKSIVYQQSS
jgi:hypothetical protein